MIALLTVLAQTIPGLTGAPTGAPTEAPTALPDPDTIVPLVTPTVDWTALAPLLVLSVGALLLLTIDSLWRGRKPGGFYALWTVVVASAAGLATIPLWNRLDEIQDNTRQAAFDSFTAQGAPPADAAQLANQAAESAVRGFSTVGGAIGIDGFGLFLTAVICASVVLGALISSDYLRRENIDGPSLYVLMLLSAAGGVIMAMSNDLVVLFLGLETLSIAAYVLAAMHTRKIESQEAGLKYFVLGGFSSAFFLYGIAMMYGATGTTSLIGIRDFLAENLLLANGLLILGLVLMLVGLAFKVAAVPFHTWAPDVYDGSPSPVVGYMASGVKVAGFAALLRVFVLTFDTYQTDWQPVMIALAVLSLFGGAVLAIVQTNVKRMLAYSSIAHAGFILLGVALATPEGTAAVLFYLAAYTFLVAGSFAVVAMVDREGDNAHQLDDYRGLGRSSPLLAFTFTIFLLAQAGVPLTSGFMAKFGVVSALAEDEWYWLAVLAMVSTVIAAAVYLRIVFAMYVGTDAAGEPVEGPKITVPFGAKIALVVCFVFTLAVGIYPKPLIDWSDESTPELVRVPEPAPADAATDPTGLEGLIPGG